MLTVPDEPCEGSRARCPRPRPPGTVHHRQSVAEHVHARERASVEDRRAARGFQEGQPQQYHDARAQIERVADEPISELEWRVRDDRFGAGGRLPLHQKIDAVITGGRDGLAVVNQAGHDDLWPASRRIRTGALWPAAGPHRQCGSRSARSNASVASGGVS